MSCEWNIGPTPPFRLTIDTDLDLSLLQFMATSASVQLTARNVSILLLMPWGRCNMYRHQRVLTYPSPPSASGLVLDYAAPHLLLLVMLFSRHVIRKAVFSIEIPIPLLG